MSKTKGGFWFLYGLLVSSYLTGKSLLALFDTASADQMLTAVLFLPVTLYFLFYAIIKVYQYYYIRKHGLIAEDEVLTDKTFTLRAFFSQDNALFHITLGLLSLAVSGTILRGLLSLNPGAVTQLEWFDGVTAGQISGQNGEVAGVSDQ